MNRHETFRWTDENTARLREMHAAGATMLQMTVELRAPSRSSIIGKCHRLGLTARTPANCVPPKVKQNGEASPLRVKLAKQHIHPGLLAKKAANKARERAEPEIAPDHATVGTFDKVATQKRPDAPGVLFLDRRVLQCAMPLPGWDDLPVTEKLVCGLPTVGGTSWCLHHLPVVTSPAYRHTSEGRANNRFRVPLVSIRNWEKGETQP